MNIEEIETPKLVTGKFKLPQRCSRKVNSTGSGYFHGSPSRCGRSAKFRVDGIFMCYQHAGEFALKYLLKQTEK